MGLLDWYKNRPRPLTQLSRRDLRRKELLLQKQRDQALRRIEKLADDKQTLFETGNAVIFTAITLAIGVATWSFSALKFQADMGLLLTFMFVINMIMAVTMLPALAVVIDMLIPRGRKARVPSVKH